MEKYVAGPCPKGCGRESRYEVVGSVVWQNCYCGFSRPAYSKNSEGILIKHVQAKTSVRLPKLGTRLSNCLLAVAEAGTVTTGQVAKAVELPTGDTATQLTILSCRGLVERVLENKGVAGGSTWELTETAAEKLRL